MARGTKKDGGHKGLSYTKFGYIFIAPFCVVYLIFSMYPLLTTFWYSVCNPKSTTADFWGFSDKDVYYDQYLDLSSKSVYQDEDSFTEATGLTYDEYRLIKDYFNVQKAANETDILDAENIKSIIAIGTADNGNGYSLSQDTINVLQKVVDTNSIAPLSESYKNDYANNAYTDLAAWKDSYNDPQAFVQDNMDDIHAQLNAIANPEASDDEDSSDPITAKQITSNTVLETVIENLSEEKIAGYSVEQQAIIKAIEEKIGQDDLQAYFTSIIDEKNSIEDPAFYYAIKNLSAAKSAYSYVVVDDYGNESVKSGVFDIDGKFLENIETYLGANTWNGTINSLSTFESMDKYFSGEKDVFADRQAIANDLKIVDDAGIMTLVTYDVAGDEVTVRVSNGNKLDESLTSINRVIEKNKPSDEKLSNASLAMSVINKYYKAVVECPHDSEGKPDADLSKISAVEHANSKGFDVEKYVSFDGELNIKSYREYKNLVGLSDKLSLAKYEDFDQKMKASNKAAAEKIIATTYQDPEVKDGTVSTMNIDDNGNFYYDVDVKGRGSEEVVIVEGKTLQEQLDFIQPRYEQHLIDHKDIIEAKTDDEVATKVGLKGGNGSDRFDIKNAYFFIYNRLLNANRQIANPTGVFNYVDSTNEYIFTGSSNFKTVFTDKTTRDTVFGSFVATAVLWIMGFTPQILLALLLSNWFTDNRLKLKGLNLMKALMYLPNVITAVTIAVFFRRIFSYSTGGSLSASQIILKKLTGHGYNFFASPWASRWLVAFINFWMWYGNTMIVLIAGITSINESLFESAQIDGANSYQTYTKITLPLLRPILLYTFVSSLIGGLQMYDIPKNVINTSALINFNGTRIYSLRTVLMYVNEIAFGAGANKMIGIAAAVSVILFIVTTFLSIIIFYLMRDKDAAKAAKAKKLARKAVK